MSKKTSLDPGRARAERPDGGAERRQHAEHRQRPRVEPARGDLGEDDDARGPARVRRRANGGDRPLRPSPLERSGQQKARRASTRAGDRGDAAALAAGRGEPRAARHDALHAGPTRADRDLSTVSQPRPRILETWGAKAGDRQRMSGGRAVGDDLALGKHDDPSADRGELDVVRRDEDARSASARSAQNVGEALLRRMVEPAGRLVEQEHLGSGGELRSPARGRAVAPRTGRADGPPGTPGGKLAEQSGGARRVHPRRASASRTPPRRVSRKRRSAGVCGTSPTLRASAARRLGRGPSTEPRPERPDPCSAHSSDDLPDPLRPIRAVTSPARSSRSTSRTATVAPYTDRRCPRARQRRPAADRRRWMAGGGVGRCQASRRVRAVAGVADRRAAAAPTQRAGRARRPAARSASSAIIVGRSAGDDRAVRRAGSTTGRRTGRPARGGARRSPRSGRGRGRAGARAARTSSAAVGSSAEVGSSSTSTRGCAVSTEPIATRCCCPPESVAQRSVAQLGDAEEIQCLLDAVAHDVGGQAELLHRVGQLLLDGVGGESRERVLGDEAHDVGQLARRVVARVAARDRHPAREVPPVKCGTRPLRRRAGSTCPNRSAR